MLTTWGKQKATNNVSEELLDENIENIFRSGKADYIKATQNELVHNLLDDSYSKLRSLVKNDRLLALPTNRHKNVLFDTYYYLGEIMRQKDKTKDALTYYLKAVKIKDDDMD